MKHLLNIGIYKIKVPLSCLRILFSAKSGNKITDELAWHGFTTIKGSFVWSWRGKSKQKNIKIVIHKYHSVDVNNAWPITSKGKKYWCQFLSPFVYLYEFVQINQTSNCIVTRIWKNELQSTCSFEFLCHCRLPSFIALPGRELQ